MTINQLKKMNKRTKNKLLNITFYKNPLNLIMKKSVFLKHKVT